jgi:hypothetical protein
MNQTTSSTGIFHRALLRMAMLIIAVTSVAATAFAAGQVQITTSLDSAYLLMGKQTTLHIDIVQNQGAQGRFVNVGDTLTSTIDVVNVGKPDTSDIGSGREEIRQQLIIQSFDSGLYTIPPFVYVCGNDTFTSNDLPLKVIPVNVDSLQTIHDYADTVEGDWRIWDFVPDFIADYWWIILLALLVVLAVVLVVLLRKKKVISILPQKKPVPPYELAIQALMHLKEAKLCESGREKEFYTRLTEILRTYLQQRFGINAMEMTTTQIMQQVKGLETTRSSSDLMKQILEMADFVKFAKVRPIPDDNVKSFNMAMRFVEDTKPAPQPEDTPDSSANADASKPGDKEQPNPKTTK